MSSSFAAHLSRRSGRGMGVLGALAVIGALSAGCAESHRSLLRPVGAELARRGLPEIGSVSPSQVRASEAVQKLLASPLSLQAALRIALAQNRRLQAQAEELGVARAALTAATLPPLEASATYHLGTLEIDVLADVLSLLELPGRRQAAHAQLDRARAAVVGHAVRLAAEVEISYGGLQAAMAKVTLRQLHFDAASAAALVQERAHEAGGATELALARKLDQRETARSLLGRAQVELLLARERLGKALGLSGADPQWTVAEAPPVLPAKSELRVRIVPAVARAMPPPVLLAVLPATVTLRRRVVPAMTMSPPPCAPKPTAEVPTAFPESVTLFSVQSAAQKRPPPRPSTPSLPMKVAPSPLRLPAPPPIAVWASWRLRARCSLTSFRSFQNAMTL